MIITLYETKDIRVCYIMVSLKTNLFTFLKLIRKLTKDSLITYVTLIDNGKVFFTGDLYSDLTNVKKSGDYYYYCYKGSVFKSKKLTLLKLKREAN